MRLGVRELAEKAGVTSATVSNVEAGKKVREATYERLANALGVTLQWLLTGK